MNTTRALNHYMFRTTRITSIEGNKILNHFHLKKILVTVTSYTLNRSEDAQFVSELINNCPNLNELHLTDELQDLSWIELLDGGEFKHLTYLHIDSDYLTNGDLVNILSCTPHLQKLNIRSGERLTGNGLATLPAHAFPHLTEITWNSYLENINDGLKALLERSNTSKLTTNAPNTLLLFYELPDEVLLNLNLKTYYPTVVY